MSRRPRSHVLEDLAKAKIVQVLSSFGWTVEPLHSDYGEDFLITVFKRGAKTDQFFFLQSKATDSIERYVRKQSDCFHVPIEHTKLQLWSKLRVPVVLTLFDAKAQRLYWLKMPKTVPKLGRSPALTIRRSDTFSQRGTARLKASIEREFAELAALDQSTDIILRNLKKITKLKIAFEPKGGLLVIPSGRFSRDGGQDHWIFFGPLGEFLQKTAAKMRMSRKKLLVTSVQEGVQRLREQRKHGSGRQ